MITADPYCLALFDSVHYALKAEKILKAEGIPHKLIPVPKHVSADCGVCLRFPPEYAQRIEQVLTGQVALREIRKL